MKRTALLLSLLLMLPLAACKQNATSPDAAGSPSATPAS